MAGPQSSSATGSDTPSKLRAPRLRARNAFAADPLHPTGADENVTLANYDIAAAAALPSAKNTASNATATNGPNGSGKKRKAMAAGNSAESAKASPSRAPSAPKSLKSTGIRTGNPSTAASSTAFAAGRSISASGSLATSANIKKSIQTTSQLAMRPPRPQIVRKSSTATTVAASNDELSQLGTRKRPAWDTKGRLEDVEQFAEMLKRKLAESTDSSRTLQNLLEASEQRVFQLEDVRAELETRVQVDQSENQSVTTALQRLESTFDAERLAHKQTLESERTASKELLEKERSAHKEQLANTISQHNTAIASLQALYDTCSGELERLRQQHTSLGIERDALQSAVAAKSAQLIEYDSQIQALKARVSTLQEEARVNLATISDVSARLAESQSVCAMLEEKVRNGEKLRRKLHNDVQELKGNIRVFCRVRPQLPSECEGEAERTTPAAASLPAHLAICNKNIGEQEEICLTQSVESASGSATTKSYPFSFDRVFGPGACQTDVFEEISQLVQSALDGYRVCIFAYGQTGSGKTFTMEGGPDRSNLSTAGMIPRAVKQVYSSAAELASKGWTFTMEATFLEIYNETIRDLLADSSSSADTKHEIKHAPGSGRTSVTDLTIINVHSPEEVMSLLSKAGHNRAVAETLCNDRSSRSHSVFTLRIMGENSTTDEKIDGLLNLIDLAGSERLSQSGSTGDRLKETQAINKSLSSLGDVIYALANKDSHIPFRNSKLTYLLQNSLGGNCKTLMFVNISPTLGSFQETLCSLRFATKVNSCQIGTARKSVAATASKQH